ncbi:MAG: hypothetical protein KKH44_04805 [Bacteroidetes bacterium]|nr:hypothetical protein [Bacteroidota bacterium]
MCRNVTPKNKQELCSRCGQVANPTDGWEHDWPLYGKIEIGFPAQAFAFLGGASCIADSEHFDWWHKGHPAMTSNEAQSITFEWGNGYKYDSKGRYRLCYQCQKKLLKTIGKFFGIDEEVRKIKSDNKRMQADLQQKAAASG